MRERIEERKKKIKSISHGNNLFSYNIQLATFVLFFLSLFSQKKKMKKCIKKPSRLFDLHNSA
jgi:hypothetical protein